MSVFFNDLFIALSHALSVNRLWGVSYGSTFHVEGNFIAFCKVNIGI
jgi:hypothetical protein